MKTIISKLFNKLTPTLKLLIQAVSYHKKNYPFGKVVERLYMNQNNINFKIFREQ